VADGAQFSPELEELEHVEADETGRGGLPGAAVRSMVGGGGGGGTLGRAAGPAHMAAAAALRHSSPASAASYMCSSVGTKSAVEPPEDTKKQQLRIRTNKNIAKT
jgi:hypothetical protein